MFAKGKYQKRRTHPCAITAWVREIPLEAKQKLYHKSMGAYP